jgi:septal ring factor EnvC (AmiA/AmiB activator)
MATPERPGGSPPVGPEVPDAPATLEDLRSLRRWLWVVGVWAVAASAVALIALIVSDDESPSGDAAARASVTRVERALDQRIDRLEEDLGKAGSAEDLAKLDRRVRDAEKDVTAVSDTGETATKGLEDLEDRVSELDRRVEEVEAQQGQSP